MILDQIHQRHAPAVLGVRLWPDWAAHSHVPLAVGLALGLCFAVTQVVQGVAPWWVPVAIVAIAAAPSIWDRWVAYRRRVEDWSQAAAVQELRLEIQLLRQSREESTQTVATLREELDRAKHELADARQTIIAHEDTIAGQQAMISTLQNHLNSAMHQVEDLSGQKTPLQHALDAIEDMTPSDEEPPL